MSDPCLYRVDRSTAADPTPCGMNAIRHLSSSESEARRAFHYFSPGLDAWDQPDSRYGVHLSRWDGHTYVVVLSKFPQI